LHPFLPAQEGAATGRAHSSDIEAAQYLRSVADVDRLRRLRNQLVASATATLNARAESPSSENFGEALKAVEVLRILRPSDSKSLRALCRNIKLHSMAAEPTPLGGYRAAQALVEIGGAPAAQAIFSSLQAKVDQEGLLLRAFVLWRIDSRDIAIARVRLEISAEKEKALDEDALRDSYVKNLQALLELLNDPMLGAEKNWPIYHSAPNAARDPNRLQ
jgi:hypothetical protein